MGLYYAAVVQSPSFAKRGNGSVEGTDSFYLRVRWTSLSMSRIYRVVSNYQAPFSAINTAGEQPIRCRKLDLYRSIITVGNPSFLTWEKIRQFGFARALYDSVLDKVALVAANIESDANGMRRHSVFDTYVLDKKRNVSYNLGMAFAKFYSQRILNISNLIHVEFLKKQEAVTFVPQNGNKRPKEPDLVGQTADGKWHVFEAKGVSTSSQLNAKIQEAKSQVDQIDTIYGEPPQTGSACATYIGRDRILTYLKDPLSKGGKKVEMNRGKFLESYYSPFLLAGKVGKGSLRRELIDGVEVEFYDLERASQKLSIGLDSEIAALLRENKYEVSQHITERLSKYSSRDSDRDRYSFGLDGFVISYSDH